MVALKWLKEDASSKKCRYPIKGFLNPQQCLLICFKMMRSPCLELQIILVFIPPHCPPKNFLLFFPSWQTERKRDREEKSQYLPVDRREVACSMHYNLQAQNCGTHFYCHCEIAREMRLLCFWICAPRRVAEVWAYFEGTLWLTPWWVSGDRNVLTFEGCELLLSEDDVSVLEVSFWLGGSFLANSSLKLLGVFQ